MAVTYGSYATGTSGRKFRLGWECVVTAEDATSVTVRLDIYFYGSYGVDDTSNTLSVSGGAWSAGGAVHVDASFNTQVLIWSQSQTFSKSYGATQAKNFSASLSGLDVYGTGTTASVSASPAYTVAARAYDLPAAVTGAGVTRVSDTQHNLAWTNTSPGSSSAPYQGVKVYRRDNISTSWVLVATLGVVTSWTDNTTIADRAYEWEIEPTNSTGGGTRTSTGVSKTTPAAVSSVTATKVGSDIVIAWANNATAADGNTIEKQADGGAWTSLTTVAASAVTTTATAPNPANVWKYRVKPTTTTPALAAAPVESNSVALTAAPNAPTGLGPSTIRDATEDVTLYWTHNPTDTSAQTSFQIRRRTTGGGWTTETAVTSGVSQWVLVGGTYANPLTLEWEVRTKGAHADWSPWSATASSPTSARPTATISAPANAGTVDSSAVVAVWGYYDPESSTQSSWKAELLDEDDVVIETKSAAGNATTTTFGTVVPDGFEGSVRVTVWDAAGMASTPDVNAFTVEYALPPVPEIVVTWLPDVAEVTIEITNPGTDEGEEDAIYNDVYRKIDDGSWQLVYTGVPLNTTVTDYAPTVAGDNTYRVDAVSALPSVSSSDTELVSTPQEGDPPGALWLSGGPGFSQVCRASHNHLITEATDIPTRTTRRFAGRTEELEFSGSGYFETWSVSSDLIRDTAGPSSSPKEDWKALGRLKGPHLLRAPDGTYEYVSASGMTVARQPGGRTAIVFFNARKVARQ